MKVIKNMRRLFLVIMQHFLSIERLFLEVTTHNFPILYFILKIIAFYVKHRHQQHNLSLKI